VPAQQENHHGCNPEIEYIVGWRQRPFDERGEDGDLQGIRKNGQHHSGPKT
jgi:hypothetical protein